MIPPSGVCIYLVLSSSAAGLCVTNSNVIHVSGMVSSKTSLELEDSSRTEFYGLGLGLGLEVVWPWPWPWPWPQGCPCYLHASAIPLRSRSPVVVLAVNTRFLVFAFTLQEDFVSK